MERASDLEGLRGLRKNAFVGELAGDAAFTVTFEGDGNVLYCEPGVRLAGSIAFKGSNSVVSVGRSRHPFVANATVYNNCILHVGRDSYFNGRLNAIVSEERAVVLGDACLFSFGIWMRTADPHLLYDAESGLRLNFSRDIVVGDHCWIGQDAMVLKGSTIGSGSVLSARAVLSGKTVPSNSVWGGVPARELRSGVFWDQACVHAWTGPETEASKRYGGSPAVFGKHPGPAGAEGLLALVRGPGDAGARLAAIREHLLVDEPGDRFYCPRPAAAPGRSRFARLARRLRRLGSKGA